MVFEKGNKIGPRFEKGNTYCNNRKGKKNTEEHNKKIGLANAISLKGRKASNKTLEIFKLHRLGNKNCLGKHWKIKDTSNMRAWKRKIRFGKDAPNYKGGISKIDKLIRRLSEYKQWRSDCFQRDKWFCKNCSRNDCYVTVHHVKGFNKIIVENNINTIEEARLCKELWDINNGVTLCEDCHSLTDNYKGRSHKK